MKKTKIKDITRNIRKNLVSWLAISIVMMIGCGVYFGAFFYADALEDTGEELFLATGYEDMDAIMYRGIRAEEIASLSELDGISDAEGTYLFKDLTAYAKDEKLSVTLVGLTERIGTAELLAGTYPAAADECALTSDTMEKYGIALGDSVRISAAEGLPEGFLKKESYTVTAEVAHADDYRTGYTNYMFLPQEAFDAGALDGMYTYVRIDADIPENVGTFDDAYFETLRPIADTLRGRLNEIGEKRTKELREKAEEQLEEKRGEFAAALADAEQELSSAEDEISSGESMLADAREQLAAAETALDQKEAELSNAERQYGMTLTGPRQELAAARNELADKKNELAEKETELSEAKEKLAEGRTSYQEKKSEGEAELADAEKEIGELDASVYVLLTRNEKDGFVSLKQMVDVLKRLATVFVAIFLIIGVVVVSSTLSIVIDAQKKQIGTMKAYGFRNGEIIAKYLTYGVSAAIFGMLLSILLCAVLERIIAHVIGGMFCREAPLFTFRGLDFAVFLIAEVLLAALVSAIVTYRSAIRTSAVDLMNGVSGEKKKRHQAGTGGKGTLYSRLIFRNMRSDLARVIASVIIVAGSCLMMGVGFTLYGAFNTMMSRSHAEEMHYELELYGGAEATEKTEEALRERLQSEGISFTEITKKETFYRYDDVQEMATVLALPEEVVPDYIELRDMDGKETGLPEGSDVLVQNRIAERQDVDPGAAIILYDSDMRAQETAVSGIFCNYYGRVLIVSEQGYEKIFGEAPAPNTFLVRAGERDPETIAEMIATDFPDYAITYEDRLPEGFSGLTKMYNALVVVMAGLSIIMSVFVLLNLVNIFVRRRRNELIIMGANGFSYRERIGYLLRETIMMIVCGLLGGVLVGAALTDFLVRTVEAADTTFNRSVSPTAWMIACLLEAGFAFAISAISFRAVKNLNFTDLTK